jgi:NAD(P)-dependent dehydrogenase (short-subunit alcohol dehydrogenase family)
MRLKDKVPIVTGGARGIGLAIARRYAAEGARVTIADVDTAGAAAASAMSNAHFVAAHVGDARAAENVVAETCRAFGDLDIVVNNAGIIHGADFLELEEADFDRVLRVNLKGGVPGRPGRRMVAQGKAGAPPGSIINMNSINAEVAIANHTPYCVVEGRHRSTDQGDGAGARAPRHPRQRHRPRLDHERHPQSGGDRPRR